MEKLTDNKIKELLNSMPGWHLKDGSIRKVFKTRDYPSTMGFVTSLGAICQKKNHHPDYVLMKYREVEVSFSTHSVGGVTEKDIETASEIEKIPL